jgi:hypothetical protein
MYWFVNFSIFFYFLHFIANIQINIMKIKKMLNIINAFLFNYTIKIRAPFEKRLLNY